MMLSKGGTVRKKIPFGGVSGGITGTKICRFHALVGSIVCVRLAFVLPALFHLLAGIQELH